MAEPDSQQPSQSSTFPNPPPFWKDFTPENVARIEELRSAAAANDGGDAATAKLTGLPPELISLQPPPEPVDGKWRVFSDQYTVCIGLSSWVRKRMLTARLQLDDKLPSLEDQGIERLVPQGLGSDDSNKDGKHVDRAFELKRLAKSLLLNFLELVGTLSIAPEQVWKPQPPPATWARSSSFTVC
jgi:mediator of RNA polymerase II transcription subunit 7